MTMNHRKPHPGLPGQINPPYDGSEPCAMCSNEVRSVWAGAHNMLNRWRTDESIPENKFWSKLGDLRRTCEAREPGDVCNPKHLTLEQLTASAHDGVRPMLETVANLLQVFRDALEHDPNVAPRELAPTLAPFVDTLREQIRPVALLNEAHFDDSRHSRGQPNVLRYERGFSEDRGGDFDWFVKMLNRPANPQASADEVAAERPDLEHKVCGTELAIAEHFKERIRFDSAWYGRVYCPRCRGDMPFTQFVCLVTSP